MITLTLYSRAECHLCTTMHDELLPLLRGRARVEIVDIDADRDLERRYGQRIPVLTAGTAELSCVRLDAARVERYLSAAD
jgi:hypothetical protein